MSKTTSTAKYRIFELEKEFNQSSQTIIDFLKKRKIKVTNRFSAIDEDAYAILQESLPKRNKPLAETKPAVKQEKTSPKNNNRNRRNKFGGQKQDSIRLVNYDDVPKKVVSDKLQVESVEEKIPAPEKVEVEKAEVRNQKSVEVAEVKTQSEKSEEKISAPVEEKKSEPEKSEQKKVSEQPKAENKNRRREKIFEGNEEKSGERQEKFKRREKNNRDEDSASENSERNENKVDSRGERGDRNNRKNRDSSREDGGKTQNRNRNRKNKMLPMSQKLNSNRRRIKIKINKADFRARKKIVRNLNSLIKLKLQDLRI